RKINHKLAEHPVFPGSDRSLPSKFAFRDLPVRTPYIFHARSPLLFQDQWPASSGQTSGRSDKAILPHLPEKQFYLRKKANIRYHTYLPGGSDFRRSAI